tara:strand:+ start:1243 stop:1845 length:603 start_codon:yes stop_codon:yes gene_type:complete
MRLIEGISEDIGKFNYLDKDTIITPFFTNIYCDYLINKFEKFGWIKDKSGHYDTYLSKIENGKNDCKDFLDIIKNKIEPEIIKNWTPALRNRLWKFYPVPFGKKFSSNGETELNLHVDNSLITLFIKLNDNFGGCETVFPRQNWDTSKLAKGELLIVPGVVTHPHYTKKLTWGDKYSLVGRISNLDVRQNDYYSDDIEKI